MADGYSELTIEKIQSASGVAELNRMLQILFENIPGDLDTVRIYKGYGSPENAVSAGIGSIYQNLSGGANTSIYIKESGTGATGWIAK